jgi:hypothetical protein
MFVLSRDVSAAKKVIATLLATAIVLWASGAWNTVRAANLTYVTDIISDSAPGASADHDIQFTHPVDSTGVANGEDIVITFPAGFNLANIGEEDIDILIDGNNKPAAEWSVATTGSSITLTIDTGNIAAGSSTRILVGLNATNEGVPNSQISNPSSPEGGNESYEITISAGADDIGYTRVVILSTVLVTASIDTVFNFTVYGNATSTDVNGETSTITSSSTTIPFGTLEAYVPQVLSQDLTVETNAIHGFVVTVQSDGPLESSTGAQIDEFKDNVIVTNPEAWESPLVGLDIDDNTTWGHWGITSEDATTTRAFEFGLNEWVGVELTPVIVFSHDGPADASTPGIGSTTVGFKVEISPLQEAAQDYSTVLTYIATPTF